MDNPAYHDYQNQNSGELCDICWTDISHFVCRSHEGRSDSLSSSSENTGLKEAESFTTIY